MSPVAPLPRRRRDEPARHAGRNFDVDGGGPLLYDLAIDAEATDVTPLVLVLEQILRGPVR